MAKRKASKVSKLPVTPPQSVGEVLLDQAFAEITDQMRGDFVAFLFDTQRAKWSEKRKRQVTDAMLQFANLGWAYYNERTCRE